ncbi:MAG: type II CAAX endopeptidase family protein [Clostridia bacterium]|nr:type II CAAX endopeptidase family protein [Clostridia bacterium]
MLMKFRKSHPIWFSVVAAILFMVFGMLLGYLVVTVIPALKNDGNEFALTFAVELLTALLMVLLLRLHHRTELVTRRGSSFKNCFFVCLVPLLFNIVSFVAQIAQAVQDHTPLNPASTILFYVLAMVAVGIAEEFMARAVISETLLEHFGTDSLGSVWKAAVVSGLIFGLLHLTNLMSVNSVKGVLIQALSAFAGGLMYAAVYYRTGNIWAPALLHALNDVAAGMSAGVFTYESGMMSSVEGLEGAGWLILLVPLRELLIAAFLLRKQKLPQLQQCWTGLVESKEVSEKE